MSEEFRHHLELRTQDLVRQGLTPREAARRARIEFGHIERHKEDARAARGLRLFDQISFSWLDIKLGVRMLAKYPGLSLVSVVGMAIAIAIAAGGFGFLHAALADVPLPEGDRLVVLQNTDPSTPGIPDRHAVRDFLRWREQLESVRDLAAFTTERTSINVAGAAPTPATVARMTASGFRAARVDPLFGRTLLEEDERDGAPPAVVVAYGEWQRRLGGDPDVLGREISLGMMEHTVVGVMPEGFRFPVNHGYWIPLSIDPTVEADAGPEITMFGRLAEGATIGGAQTELTTIGHLGAEGGSDPGARLRPRVLAYTESFIGIDGPQRAWLLRTVEIMLSLLLVVVAVNVSVLVYARTAARMGEIATRTALGASRCRVVSQLFAEAFVLSVIAAFVGVGLAVSGFGWVRRLINFGNPDELPFWIDLSLSPRLAAYVVALAFMAAVIAGVLPGLQATGRGIQMRLQELHAGGSRLRLGRTWTALIVTQVAIAVAVLPWTMYVAGPAVSRGLAEPEYPVQEFLRASLTAGDPTSGPATTLDEPSRSAFLASAAELARRLEAEPAVAGVAFASRFPGSEAVVEMQIEGAASKTAAWVGEIDPGLIALFDVPVLAGRGFAASDALPGSTAAVVDRVFAEELLGGQNVLGRRVRLDTNRAGDSPVEDGPGAWLEIVGVVSTFTVPPAFQPSAPKLYRPLTLTDGTDPLALAIRMRRDTSPLAFTGRLHEIVEAVDPGLELSGLETAAAAERDRRGLLLLMAVVMSAVTGSVLLLSAAGIYAMMSFTIASRRREIGIRAALGAAPTRVLGGIFRQAVRQLAAGVVGGLATAEVVVRMLGGSFVTGEGAHLLPLVALAMTLAGLAAMLGPIRRGLAVQPTEALRGE
jgi:predicted permease